MAAIEDTDAALEVLARGALHRFRDFHSIEGLPQTGAGVYTIWDDDGQLIYVGIAGRNPDGKGLHGRLKSHYQGRRSGDQFAVYVADRYVLAALTADELSAVADGEMSMDAKTAEYIREHLAFRFVEASDYAAAFAIERAVKAAALGQPPRLNPSR